MFIMLFLRLMRPQFANVTPAPREDEWIPVAFASSPVTQSRGAVANITVPLRINPRQRRLRFLAGSHLLWKAPSERNEGFACERENETFHDQLTLFPLWKMLFLL